MTNKVIIINRAKCDKCGDIIKSLDVHDYNTCSCKSLSVDGGLLYLKRAFLSMNFIELSEAINNDNNYKVVRGKFSQNDFKEKCCECESDNIIMHKGDGEYIKGNDILGYTCHTCKAIYVFSDIDFI